MDRKLHEAITALFDMSPYQINNGSCFNWAFLAKKLLGRKATLWNLGSHHAFVKYNGRFYDAECPEGVKNYLSLPCNRGHYDPQAKRWEVQEFIEFWQDCGKRAMIISELDAQVRMLRKQFPTLSA